MKWLDIEEFPGYQVSDTGLVRNSGTSKVLSCRPRKDGYVTVMMKLPCGKKKRAYAHRLVASCFIRKIPENHQINHLNFNKSDNRLENLEIVTVSENINYSQKAGHYAEAGDRSPKGNDSPHSKLVSDEVIAIRARHRAGESYKMLSAVFGVSNVQIKNIVTRKSWRHLP